MRSINPIVVPLGREDFADVYDLYSHAPEIWKGNQIRVAWYRYWEYGSISSRWDGIWLNNQLVAAVHWSLRASPNGLRTIYDITTRPAYRRQGLGSILADWVGYPCTLRVYLDLKVDDPGLPSHQFYQALGFKQEKVERLSTGNDIKRVTFYRKERSPEVKILQRGQYPMITYSGHYVDLNSLTPQDIRVEDITHALACINRYNGHATKPISVAQHAVGVSKICEAYGADIAWQALNHDNAEAYLGDINKWMKREDAFAEYRRMETFVEETCGIAFGYSSQLDSRVVAADALMLQYEIQFAYGEKWVTLRNGEQGHIYEPPTKEEMDMLNEILPPATFYPRNWRDAKMMFRKQFRALNGPKRVQMAMRSLQEA